MTPLVSIIIPCCNAQKWVAQAVQSALDQTWQNKEIIIIDDGSNDESLSEIKAFGGKIRWETGPNRGGGAARNRGLELARGSWIQFLDADDVMLPDCVEAKFSAPHASKEIICCHLALLGNSDGSYTPGFWNQNRYDIPYLMRVGAPQTAAALYRKEDLLSVGGFRTRLPCDQESDLQLRMAIQLGVTFVSHGKVGILFRQVSGSVGKTQRHKYPMVRREVLLNALSLMEATNQVRDDYKDAAAQGMALVARELFRTGRPKEARVFAAEAKHMSERWYEHVYKSWLATISARAVGFSTFESLHSVYRTLRGVKSDC